MSKLIIEVSKIDKIEKHPNADRLRIATIKGWSCIIGLDDFNERDLVVYCPPDSIIPNDLIEKYNLEYLKKGNRVKTVKLRGYISQGLVLKIPEGKNWKLGQDVAYALDITKYESPPPKYQQFKGCQPTKKKRNPLFDKYTEIENIKNYNTVFKDGDIVIITEKIHGTNTRYSNLPIHIGYSFFDKIKYFINKYVLKKRYEFVYGSHRVQLIVSNKNKNWYGEDVYGQIAKKYKLAEIIPEDYILYGEIYGKGIQDLTYGKEDINVRFFDVKYKGKYLRFYDALWFCQALQLPFVPILYRGRYSDKIREQYTKGNSMLCLTQIKEGCVIRPLLEENDPRIGRKILKSINEEYLLKKNRTEYK